MAVDVTMLKRWCDMHRVGAELVQGYDDTLSLYYRGAKILTLSGMALCAMNDTWARTAVIEAIERADESQGMACNATSKVIQGETEYKQYVLAQPYTVSKQEHELAARRSIMSIAAPSAEEELRETRAEVSRWKSRYQAKCDELAKVRVRLDTSKKRAEKQVERANGSASVVENMHRLLNEARDARDRLEGALRVERARIGNLEAELNRLRGRIDYLQGPPDQQATEPEIKVTTRRLSQEEVREANHRAIRLMHEPSGDKSYLDRAPDFEFKRGAQVVCQSQYDPEED